MIIASNWPTSDQIERRRQKEGRTVSAMPTTRRTRRMGNVTYGMGATAPQLLHIQNGKRGIQMEEREDNAQKFLVRTAKWVRNLRMSNL